MVEAREFRADLYYRLSGFTIHLPALRERAADIPLLLDHFLRLYSASLGKDVSGVAPQTLDMLLGYGWPGNIREMQNIVRQGLLSTVGPVLLPEFLPPLHIPGPQHGGHPDKHDAEHHTDAPGSLGAQIEELLKSDSENLYAETLAALERHVLTRVLEKTQGNLSHSARTLGITRGSLRNKIKSLGLSIDKQIRIDENEDEE